MKPTLIIDFDGTLCHDKFWRSLPPSQIEVIQKFLFDKDKNIVQKWMLGEYTSEQINELVAKELQVEYEELWDVFVSDCKTMFVQKDVLEKINLLRDKYFVCIVTDNMDCFDRFTVPSLELTNYFDDIINSYNEKVSKKEKGGELYVRVVQTNGSDISESILIDDSKEACDLFKARGGKSYMATIKTPLSYWIETIA